jgi:putative transposase
MPRIVVPVSKYFPYYLSVKCISADWFEIELSTIWSIFENYLYFIHHAYEIRIFCFVLLPGEFQLIVWSPLGNLSEAMNYFMRETSRRIGRESGRINQIYGACFHRSLILSDRYFHHTYKYVYSSPVRIGLSTRCHDYPYSTLSGLLGLSKQHVPIERDIILFGERNFKEESLLWLDRTSKPGFEREIQLALRRKIYELPKKKDLSPSLLEEISFY